MLTLAARNTMLKPFCNPVSGGVRRKGLLKVIGGLVAAYLLWPLGLMGLLERLTREHAELLPALAGYALVGVLSAPFVLFCVGVLETITGTRFRHISSAWNQMNEWKQGMLSFLLLWLGIGLIALLLWLAVRYHAA